MEDFPKTFFSANSERRCKLIMTVFSVGVRVLLHGSGLPSGDSPPADLQHVPYLT